ncbi:MAG TPA: GntR family transcriptional regulator [Stellaceae bacterium]|nr:GntR family transcriptional regulator [Stellaceae bacterium]
MAPDDPRSIRTTATKVCARLREAILGGELVPGQKLAIDAMGDRFGAGATPVREALNRLSSEGLVAFRDLRGFYVVELDEAELIELFRTRTKFFAFLMREAITTGDGAWEEGVVVAFHRLTKTPWSTDKELFRLNPNFITRLHEFYTALFSGCGSRWLVEFGLRLLHESDRFFWLVMKSKFETNEPEPMLRSIVEAIVARDVDRAVHLVTRLQEHVAETILNGRKAMDAGKRSRRIAKPAAE